MRSGRVAGAGGSTIEIKPPSRTGPDKDTFLSLLPRSFLTFHFALCNANAVPRFELDIPRRFDLGHLCLPNTGETLGVSLKGDICISAPLTQSIRGDSYGKYFDLQGHRGGRGQVIENTLPSFAEALRNGVTTLEMDMGLTKDGILIIWHDEIIDPTKCRDTKAITPNDMMFPYVGKNVANLTLAQIKSLDCGSLRLNAFPLQQIYPGTKLSTAQEMFEFIECATNEPVLFNIETKINPDKVNQTRSPEDFVDAFTKLLKKQGHSILDRVTHQSFDWRALVLSKKSMPELRTSALCDDTTLWAYPAGSSTGNLTSHGNGPGNWLAGIDIDSFDGSTPQERAAQAADSIGASILSPVGTAYASSATALDPQSPGWIPFTTPEMVKKAHELGMKVASWTPDRLNLVDYLVKNCSVDGIITDYPEVVKEFLQTTEVARKRSLPPTPSEKGIKRIDRCLKQHLQRHTV